MLETGIGIAAATVLCDVLLILRGVRIFIRTQKQHVLQEMSKATAPRRVIPTTHNDIQCCRCLGCLRIGDKQHL